MSALQTLYHGTKEGNLAKAILKSEIRPGHAVQGRAHLAPVAGRVYLTPSVRYAAIYALGGDFIGHKMPEEHLKVRGRHGYVFACRPEDLVDPQPDEDCVGEFVSRHTERAWDKSRTPWRNLGLQVKVDPEDPEAIAKLRVWRNIASAMTERQFRQAADGFTAGQAAGGKRALKVLSATDKALLIKWGAHVAHLGPIKPFACWRLDRKRSQALTKDASNFFEIAEPVSIP